MVVLTAQIYGPEAWNAEARVKPIAAPPAFWRLFQGGHVISPPVLEVSLHDLQVMCGLNRLEATAECEPFNAEHLRAAQELTTLVNFPSALACVTGGVHAFSPARHGQSSKAAPLSCQGV